VDAKEPGFAMKIEPSDAQSLPHLTEQDHRSDAGFSLRTALAPAFVILLGLGLRLYGLNNESVGLDEAFSMVACRESLGDMLRRLISDFVHPPLHYFALRAWLDIFGSGVSQARILSVIFGTLSIALLYVLTKYLLDRRAALLSCLLLAVSELSIMFAQEARPYAQFLLLFLCCCYLFIRALHTRSLKLWCGFTGACLLLIYTHYFGFLVLSALVLFAFLYRNQYPIPTAWWIGSAAVLLLGYLPWLSSGIVSEALHSGRTTAGRNPYFAVHVSTFPAAINFFNNGKPTGVFDSSPWWTLPIGGLLFTVPALFGIFASRRGVERQNVTLAAILWILPLLGAITAGLVNFQYNVRYVAFCAAPYYILVGLGLSRIRLVPLRSALVVLLLVYSVYSLRAIYFMHRKEDFRATVSYISQNRQPGDCGVFYPGFGVPLQWMIEQSGPSPFRVLDSENFTDGLDGCTRIWAVSRATSGNPWQRERARAERQPLAASDALVAEKRFLWVDVGLFSKKAPQ
jgi:4-amino-4-deoxy-L-arabinose transferase-like glycosyltransferase